MEEIDMYVIKQWFMTTGKSWLPLHGWINRTTGTKYCMIRPCAKTELYANLTDNPHPMAVNILYANVNFLDEYFISFFVVREETVFLYEKLKLYNGQQLTEYQHIRHYQNTEMENDIKNLSSMAKDWKYHYAITNICNRTLSEIAIVPFEDLNWYNLSANTNKCVIDFIKLYPNKIIWSILSANPCDAAVDLLLEEIQNGREAIWQTASNNTNERLIERFKKVKESLSIPLLCQNTAPLAVRFVLSECYDRINWKCFCKNPNDLAVDHIMDILEKDNDDKRVIWESLSANTNPRVFAILESNQFKIDWCHFIKNPICFAYDYEKIRKRFEPLKREIREIFLHPDNVMAKIEMERQGKNESETDFDIVSRLDF